MFGHNFRSNISVHKPCEVVFKLLSPSSQDIKEYIKPTYILLQTWGGDANILLYEQGELVRKFSLASIKHIDADIIEQLSQGENAYDLDEESQGRLKRAIEFFHNQLWLAKRAEEKLFKRVMQNIQPVKVTDITVKFIDVDDSYGETNNSSSYTHTSRVDRIIHHIDYLAQLAYQFHCEKNYRRRLSGKFISIKPDCRNNITRLAFHEFSFCTKELPFTRVEYLKILDAVESIMQKFEQNFHLLLSSFLVNLNPAQNGKLKPATNHVIYAQSGSHPHVKDIVKIIASDVDPIYPKHFNEDYYNSLPDKEDYMNRGVGLMFPDKTANDIASLNFTNKIDCRTAAGTEFEVILEICLDHVYNQGLISVQEDAIANKISEDTTLQKTLINHVITSNSVDLLDENLINPSISHIDSSNPYSNELPLAVDKNFANRLRINTDKITAFYKKKYKKLDYFPVRKNDPTIDIINPPFGGEITLTIHTDLTLQSVLDYPHDLEEPSIHQRVDIKWHKSYCNERVISQQATSFANLYKDLATPVSRAYSELYENLTHYTDYFFGTEFQSEEAKLICKSKVEMLFKDFDYLCKLKIDPELKDAKIYDLFYREADRAAQIGGLDYNYLLQEIMQRLAACGIDNSSNSPSVNLACAKRN